MSTTTQLKDYLAPKPEPAEPSKPTLSERLLGLFGKVIENQDRQQEQRRLTYLELVSSLADIELTGKNKYPSAESIAEILEVANRTQAELASAVERTVRVQQLRDELQGEVSVLDADADIKQQLIAHKTKFDEMVTTMRATGDQLDAEHREIRLQLEAFGRVRSQLHQVAGEPSTRELEIEAELREALKSVGRLRAMHGGFLSDEYVNGTSEISKPQRDLQEVTQSLDNLEGDKGKTIRRGPRWIRLIEKRDQLQATIDRDRARYRRGRQVREIQKQIRQLENERDQIKAERIKAIEG